MVDICTEKQHISQSVQETNLEEMVSVTEHYKVNRIAEPFAYIY